MGQPILTCPDPTRWLDQVIRFCVEVEAASWLVGGCWLWQGALSDKGYGKFSIREGGTRWATGAHRAAWLAFRSDIPDPQLQLDHLCLNKQCANPWHLELVTSAENTRRRQLRPKEHACSKHGRAEGNEYRTKTGYLRWICTICHRRRDRQRRRRLGVPQRTERRPATP